MSIFEIDLDKKELIRLGIVIGATLPITACQDDAKFEKYVKEKASAIFKTGLTYHFQQLKKGEPVE